MSTLCPEAAPTGARAEPACEDAMPRSGRPGQDGAPPARREQEVEPLAPHLLTLAPRLVEVGRVQAEAPQQATADEPDRTARGDDVQGDPDGVAVDLGREPERQPHVDLVDEHLHQRARGPVTGGTNRLSARSRSSATAS